ncbi:MAG TPA: efflux RND transporter periplasmic adaptor subunit [Rhizomicrobium sp.]
MNIRFPNTLQTMPAAVQGFPDRIRRASSRTWLILGIAAVAVLGYAAWRIFGGPSAPQRPVPPVLVAAVQRQDMTIAERTIGTVVANATVQLTARVQGQLLRANFKEGQIVHAGDLLFEIDPRPYQAAYDSAMASLASARAKADRYARLLAQKAIAPQDADDARASYLEAKAAAQTAQLNLEYTRIRSPIDGKTGPILIQPGNQITASGGASGASAAASPPGMNPLVVITQIQPVKISFSLPQADLPRIQDRAQQHALVAIVQTHGGITGSLSVPIDFVGNAIDDKTGTIELRATFANTDGVLVPGQIVDVGVTLSSVKNALVVPREAVNLGPNMRYIYGIKDGKAVMIPVTVLFDDGTNMAITGKLKPGDKVVIDGQLRVLPGKPVAIVKPAPGAMTRDPTLVQ